MGNTQKKEHNRKRKKQARTKICTNEKADLSKQLAVVFENLQWMEWFHFIRNSLKIQTKVIRAVSYFPAKCEPALCS